MTMKTIRLQADIKVPAEGLDDHETIIEHVYSVNIVAE